MNKFQELCEKNKANQKIRAGFEDVYESCFGTLRNDIKKMLEIGLFDGNSMKMWIEYFPNAEIYGIEYAMGKGEEFECLNHLLENKTNNIFYGDQSDRGSLSKFINKYGVNFSIIVDDGGHCMNEQQISFGYLFPYIQSGGYYIIEDLHTSLVPFPNRWNIGLVKQKPIEIWWKKLIEKLYKKENSSLPPGLKSFKYKFKNEEMKFPTNGTPTKTTLEILQNYNKHSKIESDYMTDAERLYLNDHIKSIDIHYTGHCNRDWGNKHVIAVIIKK